MNRVVNAEVIIYTDGVALIVNCGFIGGSVLRSGYRSCVVKLSYLCGYCFVQPFARIGYMERLLIARGPHYNARSVAVALYKWVKLLHSLLCAFKPSRLVHNQKALLVECVHIAFCLLIMTCAVAVSPHFLHKRDLVFCYVFGHGKPCKPKILVRAHTVYKGGLSV